MYVRKLQKFGNSLVVVIPPELCEQLNLRRGDLVGVSVNENLKIIICAVDVEAVREAEPQNINYAN